MCHCPRNTARHYPRNTMRHYPRNTARHCQRNTARHCPRPRKDTLRICFSAQYYDFLAENFVNHLKYKKEKLLSRL